LCTLSLGHQWPESLWAKYYLLYPGVYRPTTEITGYFPIGMAQNNEYDRGKNGASTKQGRQEVQLFDSATGRGPRG
jgi:hypothetical protein